MEEILRNKIFLVITMTTLIVGGVIYFVFQEFAQLENQLASLQEQVSLLETPVVPATSTPISEPESELEPEVEPELESEEDVNACDYLNCDNQDGWVNSGSTFTCQDGTKTCTCQNQTYHNYSCSSLQQKCVYSTTNTRVSKYSCIEPEPELEHPDLVVQSPGFSPATPLEGDNMTFWATIKNQGEASTASSLSYVRIDGEKIAEFSTVSLASNESIVVTGATTWPATVGSHELKVCADGNSVINESNETNNCTEVTFTVEEEETASQPDLPDLIVQSLSISPASTTVGQVVDFSCVVKNQGTASAGSSLTLLKLDLDNNGSWDEYLGAMSTNALEVDETRNEVWFDVWTASDGTHKFEICADSGPDITESDETNNCSSQTIVVAP